MRSGRLPGQRAHEAPTLTLCPLGTAQATVQLCQLFGRASLVTHSTADLCALTLVLLRLHCHSSSAAMQLASSMHFAHFHASTLTAHVFCRRPSAHSSHAPCRVTSHVFAIC